MTNLSLLASRRSATKPAEHADDVALTALVSSSLTRTCASSDRWARFHSHSTCLVCNRPQGTAVGRAASSRKLDRCQLRAWGRTPGSASAPVSAVAHPSRSSVVAAICPPAAAYLIDLILAQRDKIDADLTLA